MRWVSIIRNNIRDRLGIQWNSKTLVTRQSSEEGRTQSHVRVNKSYLDSVRYILLNYYNFPGIFHYKTLDDGMDRDAVGSDF